MFAKMFRAYKAVHTVSTVFEFRTSTVFKGPAMKSKITTVSKNENEKQRKEFLLFKDNFLKICFVFDLLSY